MSASLPRPWLDNYPPGVPHDIDPSVCTNLVELLETSFRRYRDRKAAVFLGEAIRFGEVDELSEALGAYLQSKGLVQGARVALMMPNVPQYLVAIAAVLRAGYAVVNVNPLYTARELEHQLVDSGAEAIVILENFAVTLQEVIDRTAVRHVVLASMGDVLPFWRGNLVNFVVRHVRKMVPEFELPMGAERSVVRFNMALADGTRLRLQPRRIAPEAVAFLQYTGGTTGVSKGAVLTHRNVVANILQTEAWFMPTMHAFGDRQATVVCALPLYHIYALTICYFMGARFGQLNLLIPNPRDIPGFVKALEGHKLHVFPGVNTLFNALAADPDFARLDFSELLVSNGGGMAVQEATAAQWAKVTGSIVVEGYGLSETSPVATSNRLDEPKFTGTVGLPVPGTDIRIRDDEGRDVELGQPGEICIRGPQVMAGYWNRPDETARVMTPDGYFKSGDIGVMDVRGYVRIVDRKKDMVLVSGFNVYPTEIEQVVNTHPDVYECAAIGIPDAKSGEAVKLFVVRKNRSLTEADVMSFCKENFTAYKRPKVVEFRDELPKSNVGKILRRELRSGNG